MECLSRWLKWKWIVFGVISPPVLFAWPESSDWASCPGDLRKWARMAARDRGWQTEATLHPADRQTCKTKLFFFFMKKGMS